MPELENALDNIINLCTKDFLGDKVTAIEACFRFTRGDRKQTLDFCHLMTYYVVKALFALVACEELKENPRPGKLRLPKTFFQFGHLKKNSSRVGTSQNLQQRLSSQT